MNNELVYPLNFSDILDISEIIPDIEEYKTQLLSLPRNANPSEIISDKFKNWLGIPWDVVLMFYKSNGFTPKIAHLDNDDPSFDKTWGINFHFGGSGLFQFFRHEDVTKVGDLNHGAARDCIINADPIKSYYMPEGAYLVFTHLPHRVIGYQERFCVSLRCESMYDQEPEQIIKLFKDYIIDKPLLNKAPD